MKMENIIRITKSRYEIIALINLFKWGVVHSDIPNTANKKQSRSYHNSWVQGRN